jgi:hypothetical protein
MDERWEDIYACIAPYTVVINDEYVEFYKLGMYVWWNGKFYWNEQSVAKDMLDHTTFEVLSWILNQMVSLIDG